MASLLLPRGANGSGPALPPPGVMGGVQLRGVDGLCVLRAACARGGRCTQQQLAASPISAAVAAQIPAIVAQHGLRDPADILYVLRAEGGYGGGVRRVPFDRFAALIDSVRGDPRQHRWVASFPLSSGGEYFVCLVRGPGGAIGVIDTFVGERFFSDPPPAFDLEYYFARLHHGGLCDPAAMPGALYEEAPAAEAVELVGTEEEHRQSLAQLAERGRELGDALAQAGAALAAEQRRGAQLAALLAAQAGEAGEAAAARRRAEAAAREAERERTAGAKWARHAAQLRAGHREAGLRQRDQLRRRVVAAARAAPRAAAAPPSSTVFAAAPPPQLRRGPRPEPSAPPVSVDVFRLFRGDMPPEPPADDADAFHTPPSSPWPHPGTGSA